MPKEKKKRSVRKSPISRLKAIKEYNKFTDFDDDRVMYTDESGQKSSQFDLLETNNYIDRKRPINKTAEILVEIIRIAESNPNQVVWDFLMIENLCNSIPAEFENEELGFLVKVFATLALDSVLHYVPPLLGNFVTSNIQSIPIVGDVFSSVASDVISPLYTPISFVLRWGVVPIALIKRISIFKSGLTIQQTFLKKNKRLAISICDKLYDILLKRNNISFDETKHGSKRERYIQWIDDTQRINLTALSSLCFRDFREKKAISEVFSHLDIKIIQNAFKKVKNLDNSFFIFFISTYLKFTNDKRIKLKLYLQKISEILDNIYEETPEKYRGCILSLILGISVEPSNDIYSTAVEELFQVHKIRVYLEPLINEVDTVLSKFLQEFKERYPNLKYKVTQRLGSQSDYR